MTDQLRISDSGEIEAQPLTADGQPLYSEDTVRELFSSEAFKQLRGQMAMSGRCPSCGSEDTYPTSLGTVRCNACGEHDGR